MPRMPDERLKILKYALESLECVELLQRAPTIRKSEYVNVSTEPMATESANSVSWPVDSADTGSYIPRKLKFGEQTLTDVQLIQTAHTNRMPTLLYGPPGTGKTSMVMAAIPDCIVMAGTSETEASDFVGSWVQKPDGNYEWVDGPLVEAMELGVPLLVDEISLIDPRSAASLYSVMDGRDTLYVTLNPARGTITAQDGFMVFGACNPDTPGSIMSEALLSRFTLHVEVTTDFNTAKKLGVDSKIVTVAKTLMSQCKHNEVSAFPQLRNLLAFRDTQKAYGEVIAIRNFIGQAELSDRENYAKAIQDVYGHRASTLTI